jgi:hypothetical protein
MSRSIRSSVALISSAIAGLSLISSAFGAVTPVVVGSVTLPPPANDQTYSTSFNYDSAGALYAWDGQNVDKIGSDGKTLTLIGHAPAGNQADAGPISFSQDGTQILIGNGSGGENDGNAYGGLIFQLPKSGVNAAATQVGNVPYHFDFVPVPLAAGLSGSASTYFVDQGNATFDGSSVTLFNSSNGADLPLISNIPGASASLAFNPLTNRLYAEIGFGTDQGEIRSFSLSALDAVATGGPAINFSTGTLFSNASTPQSGAGLFFDHDGYLFAGGDGGITVYNSYGTVSYEQTGVGYAVIAYNSALDQVLEGPDEDLGASDPATLYVASSFESAVPEPASLGLLTLAGAMALGRRRRAKQGG